MKLKALGGFLFLTLLSGAAIGKGFYGSVQPIPQKIQQQMQGYTWHKGCPLSLKAMRYLTITYYGFDHKDHVGHLIVLKNIALETLEIFQGLYQQKYPIESMVLPSSFKSKDDWKSTEHDNTAAYFCRKDDQVLNRFSPHSFGIAIDINPLYNPSRVAKNKVQPEQGKTYLARKKHHQGMIRSDGKVVKLFAQYGWKWGGYWPDAEIDYMHFQKAMDHRYTCTNLVFTKM